jgi:PAS domain S-box-containing protein
MKTKTSHSAIDEPKTQPRLTQLSSLHETLLDITAQRDPAKLLQAIVMRAARLLGGTSGGLYLCDAEKQECTCAVSYRTPRDYTGVVLRYGEGAAGKVAASGQPLRIDDYRAWDGRARAFAADPIRALLAAPLLWRGRATGVIDVMGEKPFTEADLQLLSMFASQAAIAVENARALESERAAHAEAEAARQQQAKTLARVADGFVAFDAKMNYTYVNEKGGELLGRKPEDLLGKNYWKEYPEAKGTPFANAYVRALETQTPIFLEDYYEPFDRWFENRIYPSPDGLSIFFSEITARKKMEAALRESERYNRNLFESSPIGLALCRMDGSLVDVNTAYAAIIGRTVEETLRLTYWDITPEEYAAQEQAQLESLRVHGCYGPYEKEYIRKDGHLVPVRLQGLIIERGGKKYIWSSVEDITERKRAEEALNRTAASLNEAQRIAHIGSWELDITNNILAWSDEIYRMFEIDPTKFGASYEAFLDAIHPDDREAVNYAYTNSLKAKIPYAIDHRLLFPDGRIKYVHEQCETFYDNDKPTRSVGTVQDITARKQADMELRESEERYRQLVELLPDAIVIDHDGKIVYINPAAVKLTGAHDAAEIIGRSALDFVHPNRRKVVAGLVRESLEKGIPLPLMEEKFIRVDGIPVDGEVTSLPTSYQGKPARQVIIRDITERKRAEEQRREAEYRYRALFEQSHDAIFILDLEGVYKDVNRRAADMLGYTVEEMRGLSVQDLSAEVPQSLDILQRLLKGEQIPLYERLFRKKNGEILPVEVNVELVRDALGNPLHIQSVARDITERKRAEEEIRRRVEELSALNALGIAVSATLSLEDASAAVVKGMLKAVHPDLAFLFLRQGEKLVLKGSAPKKAAKRLGEIPEHRVGECMCGLAVREGRPLYSRDIFADARCTWEECKKAGFRSFAALPLRSGTEIIGVVGLSSDSERDFEAQAGFLETLTSQAAVALQNALLYEDNRRKLEMLDSLYGGARRLAESLDMGEVAAHVARSCVKNFGVKLAWLLRAEPEGAISTLTHYPQRIEYPAKAVIRWDDTPQGRGPTGCAVRGKQPVVTPGPCGLPELCPLARYGPGGGLCHQRRFPAHHRPAGLRRAQPVQRPAGLLLGGAHRVLPNLCRPGRRRAGKRPPVR